MGRGWTAAMPAGEVGTRQPKVAAAAAGRDVPGREGWGWGLGRGDGASGTGQAIRLRPQYHPPAQRGPPSQDKPSSRSPAALPSPQPGRWVGRPGSRAHLRLGGELDHRLSEIQLGVGRPHIVGARSGPAPTPTPAPAPARDPAPAPAPAPRPPLLSQEQSSAPHPARRPGVGPASS